MRVMLLMLWCRYLGEPIGMSNTVWRWAPLTVPPPVGADVNWGPDEEESVVTHVSYNFSLGIIKVWLNDYVSTRPDPLADLLAAGWRKGHGPDR